ncbi:MAG: tRNA uridine-5-carboxymethylaminomethyl(34) synthesis enzyme MnmG [Sphaerochaeta sp.]|jgi:tRNA uridine 5-carboxymethylaminomethyl modification enzyme|uniref:tRNA uridine 5-carboxymethylaminomethyl modification enzyme MnmG n=6 Tax=root TaxID=1 RepID=A0ABY4DDP6_9SPIR|nr:tRNA uridine-5-carboxymethylaminomethyl(34) synthesis enzyme MnmG [Sphaerochaeta associata]MDD2395353.1 tRNA uridine-5-carboxymethylaminomethyl(34) synthesis enzyme MnmG [Sphaerochaeta sp.]MDT3359761.1 tRNA uridine-5-carboxymethylaminomethyl(34) synthesis enzyme MnmG [Spirochaetota bacterium]MDD4450214.1 tRNA uridine-5-carboxymethylaminomethyl(34) synthesis enzyme MnmG [Sphaerochaeta sp.]UOM52095.1 tRNA uridine-5-carboxymethylaminomethyl(34) synthesis enzyme MnmG [Sphaerochaeta associata]SM
MDYDAIVVGGGHAGIEACLALSRIGFSTLLITQNLDTIGKLSCNPAIGGLSKGNLVREVDALGGEMAHLIDHSMIQYRILNRRRGPAVQAPRAQADKFTYARLAKETLEAQSNLALFMDTVVDILLDDHNALVGVVTERRHTITCKVMVLTTGTFMEGRIFIGEYDASNGRLDEPAAIGLGSALRKKGFPVGRLKTGTPARVRRSSLDFDRMEIQDGEETMMPFSFDYDSVDRPALPCYITWTNDNTHRIIRENIHRSPLYGGKIVGKGPRYCPSIEDKVVRFPDRERHQIFVEPEGVGTEEMYLNGISSSLPEDVQHAFIHSIAGLEHAQIMRPAYAVEYDFIDPQALFPSLESKLVENLFIAGQTNGTSGYEEAACQGLMAGINAAQKLKGEKPLVLSRNEAYTGVLIDDLVTMGTQEPYRMFTSRAEYRLNLRHDSCDQRLTAKGFSVGLQKQEALDRLKDKLSRMDAVKDLLRARRYEEKSALQALKMPEVTIEDVSKRIPELQAFEEPILYQVELDVKYEGYINRQDRQISRFEKLESLLIDEKLDWDAIEGLSAEGKEKLKKVRPLSVGQATRINGVRNSDIAVLIVHLDRGGRHGR